MVIIEIKGNTNCIKGLLSRTGDFIVSTDNNYSTNICKIKSKNLTATREAGFIKIWARDAGLFLVCREFWKSY